MLFLFFILGAAVGSFLCLVVERGNSGGIRGRSKCTSCLRTLEWFELIPIISWLVLRARCRTCGIKLSVKYLVWELVLGLVFAYIWWNWQAVSWGMTPGFFYYGLIRRLVLISLWALVTGTDWKSQEIPVMPVAVGILITLATAGLVSHESGVIGHVSYVISWSTLAWHAGSGIIIAGFFALQFLLSKGTWVGEGDIWLGAFLGLILGWPLSLLALVVAYIVGAIVASILILGNLAKLKSHMALGPFLAVGVLIAWWFGPELCKFLWWGLCVIPERLA